MEARELGIDRAPTWTWPRTSARSAERDVRLGRGVRTFVSRPRAVARATIISMTAVSPSGPYHAGKLPRRRERARLVAIAEHLPEAFLAWPRQLDEPVRPVWERDLLTRTGWPAWSPLVTGLLLVLLGLWFNVLVPILLGTALAMTFREWLRIPSALWEVRSSRWGLGPTVIRNRRL